MFNIYERNKERIEEAKRRMELTWRGENKDRPFFMISDVNYAVCGQDDIPMNYYDKEVMFEYQKNKIEKHMQEINDDFIPVFFPWYGTGVVQSALGCETKFQEGLDPATEGGIVKTVEDINNLKMPNPYTDGLMPTVLECIDYFVENTDAYVSVTDCQSPLNIALTLVGLEDLIYLMYDEEESVHKLMQFCTDVLIMWVKTQKKHLTERNSIHGFPHALYMPTECGTVVMSDDDIGVLNEDLYKEFVIPYLEQVYAEFGGGSLHFCGSAHHQIKNCGTVKGVTGLNNFCMGDFEQVANIRAEMPNCAVMACDYNAINMEEYANGMKNIAKDPRGLIVSIFISTDMQLYNGNYTMESRKREDIIEDCVNFFGEWIDKK